MINKRHRNTVKKVNTYPGADIASDHVPVVMNIRLQLKVLLKKKKQLLVCEEPVQVEECIETMWNGLKTSIGEIKQEIVPHKEREEQSSNR